MPRFEFTIESYVETRVCKTFHVTADSYEDAEALVEDEWYNYEVEEEYIETTNEDILWETMRWTNEPPDLPSLSLNTLPYPTVENPT